MVSRGVTEAVEGVEAGSLNSPFCRAVSRMFGDSRSRKTVPGSNEMTSPVFCDESPREKNCEGEQPVTGDW